MLKSVKFFEGEFPGRVGEMCNGEKLLNIPPGRDSRVLLGQKKGRKNSYLFKKQ